MFSLEKFGVRRGDSVTAGDITLDLATPGALFIVGAGGAGKSSLLAALAGSQDVEPLGTATLDGQALPVGETAWIRQRIALEGAESVADVLRESGIPQEEARGWLQEAGVEPADDTLAAVAGTLPVKLRRYLAVRAALRQPARLYLIDEPTVDLDDRAAAAVVDVVRDIMKNACVVMVTHNRRECMELGGHIALIAGGTMMESAPTWRFFENPSTPAGRLYVETGNCGLPVDLTRRPGEAGIWWLVPGLLCGMSRPGVAAETNVQVRWLRESGIEMLVCAEESTTMAREVTSGGLQLHHVSIPDMGAPSFSQAVDLCRVVEPIICANRGVAVHCRGGLGRTGTLLALILIWFGDTADDAMTKVRTVRPLAIQSKAQSQFLHEFAERIGGWR